MARTTVFAHHKGGTGKTTACVNVAGFLRKKGKNVLVVDADPQGNATRNLGLTGDWLDTTLADLLQQDVGRATAAYRECIYPTRCGVDVIPGGMALHDTFHILWEEDAAHDALERVLEPVQDRYDHILVDLPSGHLDTVAAGLRAADNFFLVMDASLFSQTGAYAIKQFLVHLPDRHRVPMNPSRVLYVETQNVHPVTRVVRGVFGKDYLGKMEHRARETFGTRLTKIPYCQAVLTSQEEGVPLSHLDRTPRAAKAYEQLADDLINY